MRKPASTALAAAIGVAGSVAYFFPWLWRQYHMNRVRDYVTGNRILALTYDDGPSAAFTPQVLDLLAQRAATATFFMLGRNAKQNPEIADRVLREGHDIGCHSDEHLHAWKSLPWEAVADIDAGYERLSTWVPNNAMFRPPYGKMTLPTYWSIRRRGAPVWWWTIDSGDTYDSLPSVSRIADRVRQEGGGIILMHDLDRTPRRNNFVLEVTAALLDVARQESIQVKPLGELSQ
jgi:peptidoglycan-N-acetylglucosamine deacetylase